MGFRIEPGGLSDLPAVKRLWEASMVRHEEMIPFFHPAPDGAKTWEAHAGTCLAKGEGALFVAWEGKEAVGFTFGQIQPTAPVLARGRLGYVADLYVAEECRRHGLGRLLFLALRDWFSWHGIEALDLHVYLGNPGAVAFWEKVGLKPYAQKMRMEIGVAGGRS